MADEKILSNNIIKGSAMCQYEDMHIHVIHIQYTAV